MALPPEAAPRDPGAAARPMDFARNAQSGLLTQGANAVLLFGLSIVLARWLSEPERGVYAVITTFSALGDQATQLGVRDALIYHVGRGKMTSARALASGLAITAAALVLLCALCVAFQAPLREHVLAGASPALLALGVVLVAIEALLGPLDAAARAIDRFGARNAQQIARNLLALVAVGAALAGWDAEALGALVALALARIVSLAALARAVVRETGLDARVAPSELRSLLAFGLPTYFQLLLSRVHERADVILLAWLGVAPAEIAVYAIAVNVIDRLRVVPDAVGAALLPKLAQLPREEAGAYASRVLRHTTLWVVAAAVGLALLAPPLLPALFGGAYAASVLPLYVLLPATVALTVRRVSWNYFIAAGVPGFNLGLQALAVALNVAVNLWAIPRHGIVGAAFASLISYGFEASLTIAAYCQLSGRGLRETLLVGPRDASPYARRLAALWARIAPR